MSDKIRLFGLSLLKTKLAMVGPEEFFRQTQIYNWNVTEAMNSLKTVKDVLWMRVVEASEGMRLPNGCRWFYYIPFWKPAPRIYRFRVNPLAEYIAEAYPTGNVWSFHSY